jgi:hypothetical protein
MTDILTPDERALIDRIGECYLAFDQLDQYHPADREEFAFHVHALGRIVMARAAIRAYQTRLQRPGGGRDWTPSDQSP